MEKLMKWDYDVDICDIFQNISDIQGSKTISYVEKII